MFFFFAISADDWAEDEEEEEEDEENGEEESSEMKASVKKKASKAKEKKTVQKKAHMNIIFIGHVGKWVNSIYMYLKLDFPIDHVSLTLDDVTLFLHVMNVRNACKCLCYTLTVKPLVRFLQCSGGKLKESEG